jgi:hypothetical protein
MSLANTWALQWAANSPTTVEHSVTLAGWPSAQQILAEVQLAQVIQYPMLAPGGGGAYMWISKRRYMISPDQVATPLDPEPRADNVVAIIPNCLSVTFTLRVTAAFAVGIAKASVFV